MNEKLKNYINNIWEDYNNIESDLYGKYIHTVNVCNISKKIAPEISDIDFYARAHDIGRIEQYNYLKSFNDRIIHHSCLGTSMLENFILKENISFDDEINRLRLIIGYHGRLNIINLKNFSNDDINYLNIITIADDLENGCFGALSYLEKELKGDTKGFIKTNPNLNQKKCKEELINYMEQGFWFDKNIYCQTYAEYFVFACMLAIKSINKYPEISLKVINSPCYGFSSAIDGYIYLFDKYLEFPEKEKAIKIISKYKRL